MEDIELVTLNVEDEEKGQKPRPHDGAQDVVFTEEEEIEFFVDGTEDLTVENTYHAPHTEDISPDSQSREDTDHSKITDNPQAGDASAASLEGDLVSMSEPEGKADGASGQKDESASTGTALQTMGGDLQKTERENEDGPGIGKGRMGERMVAMGLITEDQLNVALQEKKISGKMLGEILVELG